MSLMWSKGKLSTKLQRGLGHGVTGDVQHQYHRWFGHHRLDHRYVVFQQAHLSMRFGNAVFWTATILAGLILVWVVLGYLYDLSEGLPVLSVVALVLAAVIWLLGLFCRQVF